MWNLPGPWLEAMSPVSVGRFLSTVPLGKCSQSILMGPKLNSSLFSNLGSCCITMNGTDFQPGGWNPGVIFHSSPHQLPWATLSPCSSHLEAQTPLPWGWSAHCLAFTVDCGDLDGWGGCFHFCVPWAQPRAKVQAGIAVSTLLVKQIVTLCPRFCTRSKTYKQEPVYR